MSPEQWTMRLKASQPMDKKEQHPALCKNDRIPDDIDKNKSRKLIQLRPESQFLPEVEY
jgi:hypothetical protein